MTYCSQALVKRTGKAEEGKPPAVADVKEKLLFDSKKKRRKRRHRKLAAVGKGEDTNVETKGSRKREQRTSFPSLTVMKMVNQIEVRLYGVHSIRIVFNNCQCYFNEQTYKTKLRSYLVS